MDPHSVGKRPFFMLNEISGIVDKIESRRIGPAISGLDASDYVLPHRTLLSCVRDQLSYGPIIQSKGSLITPL